MEPSNTETARRGTFLWDVFPTCFGIIFPRLCCLRGRKEGRKEEGRKEGGRKEGRKLCRSKSKKPYIHTDRQTDRRTDRRTDRQTDRHTYRHTDTHTHTHTHMHIYTYFHTYSHTNIDKLTYIHDTYACVDIQGIYFRLTGKRYHSHMAGVYCIVICKNAAGRAFSFSCSFSSLLCLLLFLLLLLFLPLFLLFLFLLLLLLFRPLPPALGLFLFLFVVTPDHKQYGKNSPNALENNSPPKKGRPFVGLFGSRGVWVVGRQWPGKSGDGKRDGLGQRRLSPSPQNDRAVEFCWPMNETYPGVPALRGTHAWSHH